MPVIGFVAAVTATVLWAWATVRWRPFLLERGALACNFFKTTVGATLASLTTIGLILAGQVDAVTVRGVSLLVVSGVIGMAIGDFAFFASMARAGARQTTLLHSTAPLFLLILAWCLGTESLNAPKVVGSLLICAGVLDVTRRQGRALDVDRRRFMEGVAWGLFAALCQAGGILLTRAAGPEGHFMFRTATRLVGAAAGVAVGSRLLGHRGVVPEVLFERRSWQLAFPCVFAGTFIGVALMMIAITNAGAAVSGALLSLTPITIVPMSTWLLGDPFDVRLLIGISIAVAGVATLSLA